MKSTIILDKILVTLTLVGLMLILRSIPAIVLYYFLDFTMAQSIYNFLVWLINVRLLLLGFVQGLDEKDLFNYCRFRTWNDLITCVCTTYAGICLSFYLVCCSFSIKFLGMLVLGCLSFMIGFFGLVSYY